MTHYCGYPQRRSEPTLCGRERTADVKTTTVGGDVTCVDCRDVLEGRKP